MAKISNLCALCMHFATFLFPPPLKFSLAPPLLSPKNLDAGAATGTSSFVTRKEFFIFFIFFLFFWICSLTANYFSIPLDLTHRFTPFPTHRFFSLNFIKKYNQNEDIVISPNKTYLHFLPIYSLHINSPWGGTHMLRHTEMCRPNVLLFHQNSLDMGPILVKKYPEEGPILQKLWKNYKISHFWNRKIIRNGSQFGKKNRKTV